MHTSQDHLNSTSRSKALSLEYEVETPENVVLHYQLAGPASRFMAYMIDFIIRMAITICFQILTGFASLILPGMAQGVFLLWLFVVTWGYYIICEGYFKGKTIGKHALGLRVIHENGHPINSWMALNRNLIRAADSLPLYIPALISMFCSNKLQRLGDFSAGTVVISERKTLLPREPIILEKIERIPAAHLNQYKPDEQTLAVIAEFLTRRAAIDYRRGHEISRPLAHELARKLQFRGDPEFVRKFPMAFLARVYVTFIQSSPKMMSTTKDETRESIVSSQMPSRSEQSAVLEGTHE